MSTDAEKIARIATLHAEVKASAGARGVAMPEWFRTVDAILAEPGPVEGVTREELMLAAFVVRNRADALANYGDTTESDRLYSIADGIRGMAS